MQKKKPAAKKGGEKKIKAEVKEVAKKVSPESSRPVAELSLRERLALKTGVTADKLPLATNPLYNTNIGEGYKMNGDMKFVQSLIGQKRRKNDPSDDEEEEKV